jgi:hypothetical protein
MFNVFAAVLLVGYTLVRRHFPIAAAVVRLAFPCNLPYVFNLFWPCTWVHFGCFHAWATCMQL